MFGKGIADQKYFLFPQIKADAPQRVAGCGYYLKATHDIKNLATFEQDVNIRGQSIKNMAPT